METIKIYANSVAKYKEVNNVYIGENADGTPKIGHMEVKIPGKDLILECYEKIGDNYNFQNGMNLDDLNEALILINANFEMVDIEVDGKTKRVQMRKDLTKI